MSEFKGFDLKNISKHDIVKYASIIAGLFFTISGLGLMLGGTNSTTGIGLVLLGVFSLAVPMALLEYFTYNKIRKVEETFPQFLRDFAEAKKSGMTFPEALASRTDTDYKYLNPYIKKAADQLSWGVPFSKVMKHFGDSLSKSVLMSRVFTIIDESFKAGGDVTMVMDDVSNDIRVLKELEGERNAATSQQVIIIYFISILFLGIIIILLKLLIPMVGGGGMGFTGVSGGAPPDYCYEAAFICATCPVFGFGIRGNLCYFKGLFFFMAMIQALANGIVAGEIGSGSATAGIKHALILWVVAFLTFMLFA